MSNSLTDKKTHMKTLFKIQIQLLQFSFNSSSWVQLMDLKRKIPMIMAHELVEHCEYSQTGDETRDRQTIVISLAYELFHL